MDDFFEPRISADTRAFWEGCREHKLRFQRCIACGKVRWPAGRLCPDCLSEEADIVDLPAEGTIYSYIIMRRAFHPSLNEKVPYVVATVDLADGVRILANVPMEEAEEIRCGDSVDIDWCDSETYTRPIAKRKEKSE